MASLEDAITIAVKAHRGQKDKFGQPYILHPLRVMLQCDTEIERIVAVLHDVVKYTKLTRDDLRKAGFTEEVITALDCLTKQQGEHLEQVIDRVAGNSVARHVKMADLEQDLELLPTETEKDAERMDRCFKAWRRLEQIELDGDTNEQTSDSGAVIHILADQASNAILNRNPPVEPERESGTLVRLSRG